MGPTRRMALQAGALVALGDAWALRRAWGGIGDRLAIALAVGTLIAGAALALAPWLHALADRRPARALAAAAVAGVLLGLPLAATPTAQRGLGLAARLVLPIAVALALAAAARAPRALAAGIGLTNFALALALPRRLYPSVRVTLLLIAFAAIACALRRPPDPAAPPRRASARSLVAATALALALLLVGRTLAGLDANTRFVTHAQAPAASLVLDAVELVKPIWPPSPSGARARTGADMLPSAEAGLPEGEAGARARFAHADSLADAHLVLVTVDALRADRLRPDRMPALSALAARGVTFTHAYATAPSTAASITSLMTARHPWRLEDRPRTLIERLRAAGWNTAAFYPAGLFFDGGGPLQPYADTRFGVAWADTRTLRAGALTDAALERIGFVAAHGEPRSFFWLHYFDAHEPYEPQDLPRDAPAVDRYDAEVRAIDRALARLVDGLAQLARPTLLVVTADHGEEFGEHGGAYHGSSLYDEQVRVPLVVALLGRHLEPERVDAPVSLVELAPTLASLLEAPVFAEATPLGSGDVYAAVDTHRMLLHGSWKLIRDTRRDVDELYDLATDPREQHNLADVRSGLAATLRATLERGLNLSSVEQLAATVVDRARPPSARASAARELGAREAYAGRDALRAALDDGDATVRAEAALALGQLTDSRARTPLRALLAGGRRDQRPDARLDRRGDEPPDPRLDERGDERPEDALADRAAVMLGRLRDPAAAAHLSALCRRPPAEGNRRQATLRREAAHYLGFVGDAAAVDALFAAAADPRVRGSAYIAIGRIAGRLHDAPAAARLRERLAVEDRADARADLVSALALAGDGDDIGGIDFSGGDHPERLEAARATYRGRALAGADLLLVRARAVAGSARLTVIIDGTPLPPLELGPRFREQRVRLVQPIAAMVKPISLEVHREGAAVELDHLFLVRDVTSPRL